MENEKVLTDVPGHNGEEIVIRKLGFGSVNVLKSKSLAASVDPKTNAAIATVDTGLYQTWMVALGVKKASFFANSRTFEDKVKLIERDAISAEAGQYLFEQINKLNNFERTEELQKKSDSHSKESQ